MTPRVRSESSDYSLKRFVSSFRVLLAAMTSHARLIKDVSLPTNQRRTKTLPSSVIFMIFLLSIFTAHSRASTIHAYFHLRAVELFSQRLSSCAQAFYALQGVTDYICNSNFLEFRNVVSPVATVLHLARRGFFRLLHWLQEQPTSVVLQNV